MTARPGARGAIGRPPRVDLDPPQARDEDVMQPRLGEHVSGRMIREQDRTAEPGSEAFDPERVRGPHAGIRGFEAEPEIEQGRRTVLGPSGRRVGAQFRQNAPPAHRAGSRGQAERHGLAPAIREAGLVGEGSEIRRRSEHDRAAGRHEPHLVGARISNRLSRVSGEGRGGSVAAQAPDTRGLGELRAQERLHGPRRPVRH